MNLIESFKKTNLFGAFDKKPEIGYKKFSDFTNETSLFHLLMSFEIFFICFDEPNRKSHWREIKKMFPHAKKVEGVVGFDAALKTCARLSESEHFFVIDGDNKVIREKIHQRINLSNYDSSWVLSWSAINSINNLAYGNGGLKFWPKSVALSLNSHEKAEKGQDPTDYCFLAKYYQINNHLTYTCVNETAFQAFRAGFREGVKMSLVWGRQETLTWENFNTLLGPENRERLWIWCNVGADVTNGLWAIYGARLGFKMNAIDQFDYSLINSYDWISEYWLEQVLKNFIIDKAKAFQFSQAPEELYKEIKYLGQIIQEKFDLDMNFFNSEESKSFKESFKNPPREGLLSEFR